MRNVELTTERKNVMDTGTKTENEMNVRLGKYMTAYPVSNGRHMPWMIKNNNGAYIAHVEWYPPWRQYVMSPEPTAVFSPDCLLEIARFCQIRSNQVKSGQIRSSKTGFQPYLNPRICAHRRVCFEWRNDTISAFCPDCQLEIEPITVGRSTWWARCRASRQFYKLANRLDKEI